MALFGFSAYGVGAYESGASDVALASLSVAAAACAFLRWNFAPARIFMGDIGSIPLGFLAATFGVLGGFSGFSQEIPSGRIPPRAACSERGFRPADRAFALRVKESVP